MALELMLIYAATLLVSGKMGIKAPKNLNIGSIFVVIFVRKPTR